VQKLLTEIQHHRLAVRELQVLGVEGVEMGFME
jgi:hypothetical protein